MTSGPSEPQRLPAPREDAAPRLRRRARLGSLLWYWGPIVLYMLVIFVGSSLPRLPAIAGGVPDKVAHFTEYAVLGLLLARGLAGAKWLAITPPYVLGAIVLAALYGVSDELHQLLVPGRDFEVRDMMADAMGACASTGALWAWGIIRRNFQESGLANQE